MKKLGLAAIVAATCMVGAANATTVSTSFGPLYDFDDGPGSVATTLTGLSSAITGDLTIDFTVVGDLSSASENFEFFIDGVSFGIGCDENTSNDPFGIPADDCPQSSNGFRTGQLVIDNATALILLSDGALAFSFNFSNNVDDFVDITSPATFSGVTFTQQTDLSFAVGGTVSYESAAAVPLPAGAVLLLSGLGIAGVVGRRRKRAA